MSPATLEVADPDHVEHYWHHTRLLLDIAVTGDKAARICCDINATG